MFVLLPGDSDIILSPPPKEITAKISIHKAKAQITILSLV